jgi:hypothetical protein
MADIASNLSDKAILHLIIQEMKKLLLPKWKWVLALKIIKTLSITDRKQAIKLRFNWLSQ